MRFFCSSEVATQRAPQWFSIVIPNHVHYPAAKAFLKAGIHVICDKPLATSLNEARELADLAAEKGLVFAVTYNYSGYPMIRQAREMVAEGALGSIRQVQVEYIQDWLSEGIEARYRRGGERRCFC